MPFADSSSLMMSNGSMVKLKSTFVSEGTLPKGGTWQMLGIPDTHHVIAGGLPHGAKGPVEAWTFPPPCYEPSYIANVDIGFLGEARCSGQVRAPRPRPHPCAARCPVPTCPLPGDRAPWCVALRPTDAVPLHRCLHRARHRHPVSTPGWRRCIDASQWIHNITIYDQLTVPAHLEPGEYVLGQWRGRRRPMPLQGAVLTARRREAHTMTPSLRSLRRPQAKNAFLTPPSFCP